MKSEFIDDYEHVDTSLEYVLQNILQPPDESEEYKKLEFDFNSILMNGCDCIDKCDENCLHGKNYELKNDELLLRNDRKCKDLIYECNENCSCGPGCLNRLVQYGPRDDLVIKKIDKKGYGLITTKFLNKGSFICEYAGEVLTKTEANKRDAENLKLKKNNYIFCLNEINESDDKNIIQTFVDPSRKGNIGRYLNHSCDPNCSVISVRCNYFIPKIAIFANREIEAYEELSFSYGNKVQSLNDSNKKCFCGSKNCMNFLPNITF